LKSTETARVSSLPLVDRRISAISAR